MARIRSKNSRLELLVRKLVFALGYRYRLYGADLPGHPDLVFRKARKVIFVHGCFWHGHDCSRGHLPSSNVAFWEQKIGKNKQRDDRVRQLLRKEGWKVLAVWQCETKDSARLAKKLTCFLDTGNNMTMKRSA
jgi:DNA mismatch endonuclease (patch repair protein)